MPPVTARDASDHAVKQFTIFLENKVGRFLELVRLFADHHIHVVALAIQDTADAALARIVVDDPDRARAILLEHTIAFSECQVLVVELPNSSEDLLPMLKALMQAEVNIHFTFPFLIRPRDKAVMALHVEDAECAASVLKQNDFRTLTQADISR